MSDEKTGPCDYCHACNTDAYVLGGCYCKRWSHPSDALRTENALRTTPQASEDWVPPVEMARLSSPVDADGAPVEVTR